MQTPLQLAHQLAPALAGRCWAIGGSTLLQQLGLVDEPRGLDIVTTAADFAAVREVLAARGRDITPPPHPQYATRHYARFELPDAAPVDLIAEMAIRLPKGSFRWPFDASAVQQADGLPWCLPEDWALLYRLMGKEEQVEALDDWLGEHGVQQPLRLAANLFAQYPESALQPLPDWWPWEE
ncbi:hypothetical protein [Vogesella sp. LIG4]|uniref:hypothetical protein n=1 Tax=Vogesella sp. LIG4 TaxID=1192162 RepID=UPI00081FC98C|nr:hypothetical protein [Vogesella sp. LIG4]SCK17207.1 hypothetical protein PSELUDRAFT_1803 [Vogesella sp. LIG4]